MCSDCFAAGPQSFPGLFSLVLWNKERDVQLFQGLKSPQDSEVLSGTQKDKVCNNTKQRTAPSFRESRKKSNHWKWPQCHQCLPAAWGPFQCRPTRLPGAMLLRMMEKLVFVSRSLLSVRIAVTVPTRGNESSHDAFGKGIQTSPGEKASKQVSGPLARLGKSLLLSSAYASPQNYEIVVGLPAPVALVVNFYF